MNILDNASRHFSQQLADRLEIEIPEWGESDESGEITPARLYVKPETSAQRKRYIQKVLVDDPEGFVDLLIARCRTDAGVTAFKPADKDKLMTKCDPNVIVRIGNQILVWDGERNSGVADEEDVEDKKKQLANDHESYWLFRIAREIGQPVHTIVESMPICEINNWIAFLIIEHEEEKKAMRKNAKS